MAEPDKDKEQLPAPHSVVLPLTFSNSFWSADYRTGVSSLYTQLERGIVQSDEVVSQVERRARLEASLSQGLLPPKLRDDGFGADEVSSLRMGFEALLTSEVSEARARQALSEDLMRTIVQPFTSWSNSHSARISHSRTLIESHLQSWEKSKALVDKLKTAYDEACRTADAVEDEVNFSRARRDAEEELVAQGGEGEKRRERLPPRPDELEQEEERARREREVREKKESREREKDDDEKSEEGLPAVDSDDEDKPLASSAAGAASVIGALGRAFSVRRTGGAPSSRAARSSPTSAASPIGEKIEEEGEETDYEKEKERLVAGVQQGVEGAREGLKKLVESEEVKKGVEWSRTKFSSLLSRVPISAASAFGQGGNAEERVYRTRKLADEAEEKYRKEVAVLDGLRLTLESTLSSHLPYLQRCESDRLKAATSVLKSYHAAVSALPKAVSDSQERVGKALELVRGERDLRGEIERGRTGPFSPRPTLFTSHYAESPLTTFGIDLRKYDETNPDKDKDGGAGEANIVPPVLTFLLRWIEEQEEGVGEEECRKSWLYETPLSAQHRLRSLLLSPSTLSLPYSSLSSLLSRPHPDDPSSVVDLPIACSTVKLWLLELEVPVVTWERYEELKGLFGDARVGGEGREKEVSEEEVARVVGRLPRVHFEVLKLVITHLSSLLSSNSSSSSTSDPDPIYLQKLSLSLSRPLVRPRLETALTLDSRFPALLVSYLLSHASTLFPKAEEAAKKEREERYRPRRQRTKPVDERVRRSNLGTRGGESVDLGKSAKEVLEEAKAVPPVPPMPEKKKSLLGVDTTLNAPKVREDGAVQFAASPMSATQEELPSPVPAVAPVETPEPSAPPAAKDEEEDEAVGQQEVEAKKEQERKEAQEGMETPFTPPTEAPFVPPTSSSSPPSGTVPAPSDTPLAPSSSLKRTPGTGGSGSGTGSSSRLRGARAPRPASQVMAMAAQFEGAGSGGEGAGKRESWARTRVPPLEAE
ncbi:hypothetical protein JCM8547_002323 [Rhodosporidiobolus lusitaniae]